MTRVAAIVAVVVICAIGAWSDTESRKISAEAVTKERDALKQKLNDLGRESKYSMCTPVGESHVICKANK